MIPPPDERDRMLDLETTYAAIERNRECSWSCGLSVLRLLASEKAAREAAERRVAELEYLANARAESIAQERLRRDLEAAKANT